MILKQRDDDICQRQMKLVNEPSIAVRHRFRLFKDPEDGSIGARCINCGYVRWDWKDYKNWLCYCYNDIELNDLL